MLRRGMPHARMAGGRRASTSPTPRLYNIWRISVEYTSSDWGHRTVTCLQKIFAGTRKAFGIGSVF